MNKIDEIKNLSVARNLVGEKMVVLTKKQRDWIVLDNERLRGLLLRVTKMVTWNEYKILRKEIEEILKEG